MEGRSDKKQPRKFEHGDYNRHEQHEAQRKLDKRVAAPRFSIAV
jgi:hypothetical protein